MIRKKYGDVIQEKVIRVTKATGKDRKTAIDALRRNKFNVKVRTKGYTLGRNAGAAKELRAERLRASF